MIDWTAADDAYLTAHRDTPMRILQRTLKRTRKSIQARKALLGLTRDRSWSEQEITRLMAGRRVRNRTQRAQEAKLARVACIA